MKRYALNIDEELMDGADLLENSIGAWVRYEDAVAEIKRLQDELVKSVEYKRAVDDALVVGPQCCTTGDAKKDLSTLLVWETSVALDPRVSGDAERLRAEAYAAGMMAAAEMVETSDRIMRVNIVADIRKAATEGLCEKHE